VLCRCDCGTVKRLSLGNLTSGVTTNCADRERHPDPRFRGEAITYDGAHNRVHAIKGSASAHPCWRCGGQAEHWAYSHAASDERAMIVGKERGRPYSPNPDHYSPLCRSCHARMDRAHARTSGGGLSLTHVALWMLRIDDLEVAA
jgi:hypothetical protein